MIIKTVTTVAFEIPSEYEIMTKFEENHKEWIKRENSMFVAFTKEDVYRTGTGGNDE